MLRRGRGCAHSRRSGAAQGFVRRDRKAPARATRVDECVCVCVCVCVSAKFYSQMVFTLLKRPGSTVRRHRSMAIVIAEAGKHEARRSRGRPGRRATRDSDLA